MKKIALIHLGVDGAGPVYSFEMARALAGNDNQVLAIISSNVDIIDKWRALQNVELVEINGYISKRDLIQKSLDFRKFWTIKSAIKRFGAQILYSPMVDLWQPLIFALFTPRGVTRIKTIHDITPHDGENGKLMRLYHYFSHRNTEKIVVLSRLFIPLIETKGFESKNIIVIPHPNFDFYSTPNTLPSFEYTGRILFFGRILKYKGLDVLLRSMRIVVSKLPYIKLVVAGGGDIEPYSDLFVELGDNLELHLHKIEDNQIAQLFSSVDFVVLPYTEASQSGVIPLAYSFGKAVVASELGGIPEQVSSETGILVDPGSEEQLAQAIIALSQNPLKIAQMGRAAKQYATQDLTWTAAASKLIESL